MMTAQTQCDECFLRQARHATDLAGLDEPTTARVLVAVERELAGLAPDLGAPIKASRIHAVIREVSGCADPYADAKARATAHALEMYPRLAQLVDATTDPFCTALRLAIAGNIIDLGVGSEYDLDESIGRVLTGEPAIDDTEALRAALAGADDVLYLADNAGETVLDRLLIEQIRAPVTYVVKGGPAVNDATRADALAAGLDGVCAEIIDHGAATLGTLLDQCSEAFRQRFAAADVVIAKGMANFESLEGSRAGLFFLLQSKCAVVSSHLGVPELSIIVSEDRARTD